MTPLFTEKESSESYHATLSYTFPNGTILMERFTLDLNGISKYLIVCFPKINALPEPHNYIEYHKKNGVAEMYTRLNIKIGLENKK